MTPRNWSNVVSRQTRTADGGRPTAVPLSAVRCLRSYRLATLFVPALVWGGCATSQPRAVVVTAHSFRFEPATVEVAYQQPIRLTLRNPDVLEHDFHVDGLKAKVAAGADQHAHGGALGGQGETGEAGQGGGRTGQPGDADSLHVHTAAGRSAAVVFTPLARGTFAVSCTIPGHKEAGMAATLVVR